MASCMARRKKGTSAERRKANRLYMDAGKQFVAANFEEAMRQFEQASRLEPANKDYKPIYPENDLKVAAVVKGVVRKY